MGSAADITRSESRSLAALWLVAALGAAVLQPLLARTAALSPGCPFHALTGIPCPTCGTTRAALALLGGHPLAALGWNPLATLAGIAFFLGGVAAPLWVFRGGQLPTLAGPLSPAARWGIVAVVAANWAYLIVRGV